MKRLRSTILNEIFKIADNNQTEEPPPLTQAQSFIIELFRGIFWTFLSSILFSISGMR